MAESSLAHYFRQAVSGPARSSPSARPSSAVRAKKRPRLGEVRVAESAGEREWLVINTPGQRAYSIFIIFCRNAAVSLTNPDLYSLTLEMALKALIPPPTTS